MQTGGRGERGKGDTLCLNERLENWVQKFARTCQMTGRKEERGRKERKKTIPCIWKGLKFKNKIQNVRSSNSRALQNAT